ncbi:RNA polymerase sigma factor [Abyssalbus ytuae]|uniref:RNA polymerase sigma factor n=1 Tax=Abyssalbus ytuae TaxID=2926907 RepID=A0A9E6ZRN4_9FLAO|nr:RNA polymerase sigma factor [Abyssalbus ytuae]UOB17583.1 RNA polymerase sigma factor [Abyssalbus ytuae]
MTKQRDNSNKLKDFFAKEYSSLKTYVNSRIKSSINRDAEDIIQEVALKLFAGADRYSPINNVAGFVYYSIRNKIIDIMRQGKNTNYSIDENQNSIYDIREVFYENADHIYSEELEEELIKTLSNLKPFYRDVIIAIDFEGFTYKEFSIKTGVPEGTLMSRRHRAISLLYKKLENKRKKEN